MEIFPHPPTTPAPATNDPRRPLKVGVTGDGGGTGDARQWAREVLLALMDAL